MRIDDPLMGIQSSRDARHSLLAEALILDRLCPNCTQHSTVLRSRASCSGTAALWCFASVPGPTGNVRFGSRNYGDRDKGLAPLSLCESG